MADIEQLSNHISDLNQKIKLLDEGELSHLYELHELYYRLFTVMGDLVAEALFMRDEAYMNRKEVFARMFLENSGTVAEKEAQAEVNAKEYRKKENEANYLYSKYKSKQKSIDHKLYDIKAKRANMERELQHTQK